ncbi:MAG TPA: SpoIVB peptidase S55 domain-containing protein [Propionibacteriaceae bacterium]
MECPSPVPMASVVKGMTGEGFTVANGSTPEPFNVEVLGVLKDGISSGRDMIMIKVSDQPGGHVIDQGDGIWGGMSGSPVYVNGKLLGAVAYGFSASPSPIGGLTPAADMVELLGLAGADAKKVDKVQKAVKVQLSANARRDLATRASAATPKGTLQTLVTPLAVSGIGPKRIDRLQKDVDAAGFSVKAYAAGRVAAPKANAVPSSRPVAGGNFASVISYGDVSAGAIGTTTYVCGDQALAFGHPFQRTGPSQLGANDADILTVIKDSTYGPYKLGNITSDFGTVDQDRTVGLRADLSSTPSAADVTTTIRSLDSGKKRTGTTKVVDQAYLAELTTSAVWGNYDATFDEWASGTATSEWTITGKRAGGVPFSVSRSNQWASQGDVTVDPAFDIASATDAIVTNEFEDVTIDKIAFGSDAATKFQQLHITRMQVSVNSKAYTSGKAVTVKAGDKLTIRVSMRPYRGTDTTTTKIKMVVPKSAKGKSGTLSATGGIDAGSGDEELDLGCALLGEGCSDESVGNSFDDVLTSLNAAPRNDAVVASVYLSSDDDKGDEDTSTTVSATKLQKLTVIGERSVDIQVK